MLQTKPPKPAGPIEVTTPGEFEPECSQLLEDLLPAAEDRQRACRRLSARWPYHYDGRSHVFLRDILARLILWAGDAWKNHGQPQESGRDPQTPKDEQPAESR